MAPVSAARIHAGQTGGVTVVSVQVIAALSFYVDRLRISQAGQVTQLSQLSDVLAVQARLDGWAHADLRPLRPIAGATLGARRGQPGASPRCSAHRAGTGQEPSAGVADCLAPAGAALQGPGFQAYLRDDGMAPAWGRDTLSLVAAPAKDCWQLRSSRESTSQPVTNQVTAVPRPIVARMFHHGRRHRQYLAASASFARVCRSCCGSCLNQS